MDMSELAMKMLEWEAKKRVLDKLEDEIKATVLEIGKTQTVGNVRASYNSGRKTYDYEGAAKSATIDDEVIRVYSEIRVDWRSVCAVAEITDIPYSESEPSVSLRILE